MYKKIYKRNSFYLLLKDYISNFDNLFFSILSLTCIANSNNNYTCINKIDEMLELFNTSNKNNSAPVCKNYFDFLDYYSLINFTHFIYVQNDILTKNLETKLSSIFEFLSETNEKNIKTRLMKNISHFKINQIMKNSTINLSLSKENITVTELLLLITSRFGIIIKNGKDINSPIYILNKTGDEALNNIYIQGRLNTYQENMYLLILDYKIFIDNLDLICNDAKKFSLNIRYKFRKVVYLFNSIDFLLIFIIIIILTIYICIYFIKDILKKKN